MAQHNHSPIKNGHPLAADLPILPAQSPSAEIPPSQPLTRAQSLMWLGQALNADAPLYNMIQTFTIGGELELGAFERAFAALVAGNDALRTVIVAKDGDPRQIVCPTMPHALERLDFSQENDPDAAYEAWLATRKTRVLKLDERLFDSAVIVLSPTRHVWYLCMHHLITDGVTFVLAFERMAALYQQALTEPVADVPSVAVPAVATPVWPQYADYVAHEHAFRATDDHRAAEAFWQEKVNSAEIRTDFYGKSASGLTARTDRVTCELGAERSAALRTIASDDGFASFSADMSLSAVFSTLLLTTLHRLSGQSTLRLGTPFHARPTTDFKNTLGLFIEIGVLQVALDSAETFRSLGEKVLEETFTGLMNARPGVSSAETNRAYDVLLNYVSARFPDFAGLPVDIDWVHTGFGDSSHNLRLQVTDFGDSGDFVLHFDVNTAVFGTVERRWLIDHFLRVVDAFITDPSQPIDQFDMLSSAERQALLVDFNKTDAPYAAEQTVVTLFEAQADKTPDTMAVQRNHNTLTYAELNRRANQFAHWLQAQGVGPETRVALTMERSLEVLIAIWGVLKAGGAYVPIDPAYPAERLSLTVADAQPALLLTSQAVADKLPAVDSAVVVFDTLDLSTQPDTNPPAQAAPDNLVYMIYTSGSTGTPKGTMLTHQGLVNYATWAQRVYQAGDTLDFPLYSSLAFDLTVTSLFVPLLSGGRIVVYSEADHPRGLEVLAVFRDDAVDLVKLTPAHLALVLEADIDCQRISRLIVGGEDFKTELACAVDDAFLGRVTMFNEYGPTEAVVGCMIHRFDRASDTAASVPIGTPAANARIYLLDANDQPVPPGVIGEMVIGSDGVARGYHNRPELTAERFGDDPFRAGARIYRTGDLARWNEQGQLSFLGRRDHQVKIRGARIELGEIEAALLSHPAVDSAVVNVIHAQRQTPVESHCVRCGLPSNYPDADFDDKGVCSDCRTYAHYLDQVERYFRTPDDLRAILDDARARKNDNAYDCMVMLSGGKDSTYMLYQIVREFGMRPLVFSLDNGYISQEALTNIRQVCDHLGVGLHIATTPHMNAIFADSLRRHSNVCDGCFKTIYTLSMNLARELGIDTIITGLARGQLFETRLADTFRARCFDPNTIDDWILDARKAYHQIEDATTQLLDVRIFNNDRIFEEIKFVDFYRYTDVDLDTVYDYLANETLWSRPSDTGRSTNCLINDAGIYIHKKERGYHNYALPYSWDVRLGHKQREMAMHELDDELDLDNVRQMLAEVGYDENEKLAQRTEKRLAAYVVANATLSTSDLRSTLSERLPDFMLPSTFTQLDALPLTTNGKVDRNALPNPDLGRVDLDSRFVPPATAKEHTLTQIWRDIFRLPDIGTADNFFDLGGDSIISIQIVARARQAGLSLAPRDIFDYQTIAELAAVATDAQTNRAEQGVVTGDVPLTPIQHWFFEQQFAKPNQWNQSLWLTLPADTDVAALSAAFQQLPHHHDALRLRFTPNEAGWRQTLPAEVAPVPVNVISMKHVTSAERDALRQQAASQLAASLNLQNGPLMAVAIFSAETGAPLQAFITIHHLAVDAVSWRPLLEDVERATRQIQRGETVRLPAKTTSFKRWAQGLAAWAQSDDASAQIPFWQQQLLQQTQPVPIAAEGVSAEMPSVYHHALSASHTDALLHEISGVYNTTVNDALLTAVALAFATLTEQAALELTVEGHGREEDLLPDADLSRSVGWFTSQFPLRLQLPDHTVGRALKAVKEQLRHLPDSGIGYGPLRYLRPDSPLADAPQPQVLFNYLGHFERALPDSDLFSLAKPLQASSDARNQPTHAIDIAAFIQNGQLQMDWTLVESAISAEIAPQLAAETMRQLEAIIDHCLSAETTERTRSDFDLLDLDSDQFDQLSDLLGSLDA